MEWANSLPVPLAGDEHRSPCRYAGQKACTRTVGWRPVNVGKRILGGVFFCTESRRIFVQLMF